ncbi:MAG: cohesin domain-containing protein [Anaerolineae bacterium]
MLPGYRLLRGSIFLVSLILLLTSAAAAATVTVSAGSVQAQSGDTVEVPIQLAGAPGLGALHLELSYDASVLGAVDVSRGDLAGANALLDWSAKQPGRLIIGIVSLDGIKGDGTVAKVRFKVLGEAGKSTDLKFQNNQAWERESHAEVLVNSQPGKVTVAAGLPAWLIPAAIAIAAVLILLALLFFILRRRRKTAPQPAYGTGAAAFPPPTSYAAPLPATPAAPLGSLPGRAAPPRPMDLPELPGRTTGGATDARPFQHAEDEYLKLKGALSIGRITQEQYEAKLRELMVQDGQGRYWMIGRDNGKWYVHNGQAWVEAQPY